LPRHAAMLAGQRPRTREETVLLAGRPLRIRLRRSPRARRLTIQVCAGKGVVVVLPRRASEADAAHALAASAEWVARQATRYDVWAGPRVRTWTSGSELMVLGEPLRLEIAPLPAGRARARTECVDGRLRLQLPAPQLLDPRPAVSRWLRRFAGEHLRARTAALAEQTGLRPRRVIVGERISRWGSCSHRGTISYCYRLVMAPPAVVDAVVIHELCHLAHHDHGAEFYRLVRELCPDHDRHLAWLREHGSTLVI